MVLLNFLDDSIYNELKSCIEQLKEDPKKLEPLIREAIKQSKEEAKNEVTIGDPFPVVFGILIKRAWNYVRGVLGQTKKWQEARELIKIYGSIFLVGSGFSFESNMPLSKHLKVILKKIGVKNWNVLRKNPKKFQKFKEYFADLVRKKNPGTSHKLVAKAFYEGKILEIICLNWDDLIEKAYREVAGIEFPKTQKIVRDEDIQIEHCIWKLHGDVENLENDFILPDEGGRVFNSLITRLNSLAKKMYIFVIVGYSESEENIYTKIIGKLERTVETYRVGLDLSRLNDSYYIVGPSDFVLEKILG
ncbi:MAG: SIR2 family protein [Nitrososphaeria archaeon]